MTTLFVILALSFLIFIHEVGHFSIAKAFGLRVLEFGIGFPPRIFGKRKNGTMYSINALPFGGFVHILGEDGEEREVEDEKETEKTELQKSFISQPTWKKVAILAAGVFMNFLFGFIVFSATAMVGVPEHLVISGVQEGFPAEEAGIKAGDTILEAKFGEETLFDPIPGKKFTENAKASAGKEVSLTLRRSGKILEISLVPQISPEEGRGVLGVYISEVGAPPVGFINGFFKGATKTWEVSRLVVQGFFDMMIRFFTSPKNATENIAGPVGIVVVAKETSALGIVYFMDLLALISVNLAVLNLLPFPALDGGRIIIALIERVKGSPVPKKAQLAVNGAGLILLLILMILVTVGDIRRIF